MIKKLCVAVVDDDMSVCRALRRLFVASGLEATTFLSGQVFLKSLPAYLPDCVVLDFQMPEMTGLDVLSAINQTGLQLPVIIITGRPESSSQALCKAAGAMAYLAKPLNNKLLLQTISEAAGDR